jgi:hypothetical protein
MFYKMLEGRTLPNGRIADSLPVRIIELPPQKRTIKTRLNEKNKKFTLLFPYLQFYFHGGNLHVTASDESIAERLRTLKQVFLPNCRGLNSSNSVCMSKKNEEKQLNFKESVEHFWASTFNEDIMPSCYDSWQFIKLNSRLWFWHALYLKFKAKTESDYYLRALKVWSKLKKPPKFPTETESRVQINYA